MLGKDASLFRDRCSDRAGPIRIPGEIDFARRALKLFAAGGLKLPDDLEDEIEAAVEEGADTRPIGAAIGRLRAADDAVERYGAHLLNAQPTRLDGLHVVAALSNQRADRINLEHRAAPRDAWGCLPVGIIRACLPHKCEAVHISRKNSPGLARGV